jgi:sec-independent protein translocase protein TatB
MFGIGFTEILLISIIAILFLGPDKLPTALVEMAKFIKSVKKTIGEAKSSLEEEMKIADLKEEALSYKKQLDNATTELKGFKNIDFDDMSDIIDHEESAKKELTKKESPDTEASSTPVESKNDTVTLKKKPKKRKKKEKKSDSKTEGDA